jgi:hypothetical protein
MVLWGPALRRLGVDVLWGVGAGLVAAVVTGLVTWLVIR